MNRMILGALAAFAMVPSAASAVVVANATSVRITNAIPTWLQVAEVQAFDFANVNVAAASNGGSATGSPEYQNNGFATPDKAIDGITGGDYYTNRIYHSGTDSAGQFLLVTFAPTNLSKLTIFGRTDCCGQRDLYNVQIFSGQRLIYSDVLDARNDGFVARMFDRGSAVPEPATWALMIAGFGMVGATLRRRAAATA